MSLYWCPDCPCRRQQREALSKRASFVLKLTQEKEGLERELKEMADRLEAIEKRSQGLIAKKDPNSQQQQQQQQQQQKQQQQQHEQEEQQET